MCCISFPAGIFRSIQIQYTIIVVVIALFLFSGRNIPSNTNTIHIDCSISLSGRNIPSNTNTIYMYCPFYFPAGIFRPFHLLLLCLWLFTLTFRPEYSVQYKYNTQLLSLWLQSFLLSGRNIPSNTNTIHIYCSFLFSGRNIPSNTNTIHIDCSLSLSGRNIPSNTNTIHIDCCFVCPAGCINCSLSGRNIPSNTNTIHNPAGIFRSNTNTIYVVIALLHLFYGRNIPSNTNTIHIYCCFVCVASTFRPEYSVQYKYNTQLLSLWLHCFYFPAGIFRQIQIQYTFIVVLFVLHQLSGRNIPSNTNTIHMSLLCCISFPAGIFRSIQIQYTIIVIVIALLLFSGRNTPSNTNTIHIYCCFVCVASTFRPEYSVQYKYNTHSLLCCISFPAGIFRSIQIQYTIIVVVIALFLFSGRNIPSNTNTIHIDCCVCVAFTFRPEFSGRNILSNTNTMHIYC